MSVEDEVKTLTTVVTNMDKKLDLYVFKCDAQEKAVERLKKDVNGNGRIGMKTKVGVMWIVLGVIGGTSLMAIVGIGIRKLFGA